MDAVINSKHEPALREELAQFERVGDGRCLGGVVFGWRRPSG